jgi:hypothetical protein
MGSVFYILIFAWEERMRGEESSKSIDSCHFCRDKCMLSEIRDFNRKLKGCTVSDYISEARLECFTREEDGEEKKYPALVIDFKRKNVLEKVLAEIKSSELEICEKKEENVLSQKMSIYILIVNLAYNARQEMFSDIFYALFKALNPQCSK